MMRILLLGCKGQLGSELQMTLALLGEIVAWDLEELDLAQTAQIPAAIHEVQPNVIVNASAYTAVDRAETEPDLARAVNAEAPMVLAREAHRLNASLIHFSTDYVFDGTKGEPYHEQDEPNPINVYGQTKLGGEKAVQTVGGAFLIFRTSWVYSLRFESFPRRVLRWARSQSTLRIVEDQVSGPTWSRMLAETTALLLAKAGHEPTAWIQERSGLYHLGGSGYASRFDWARAVLELDPRASEQLMDQLQPATSDAFPTPAKRPSFSALDCQRFTKTFDLCLPPWEQALLWAMEEAR